MNNIKPNFELKVSVRTLRSNPSTKAEGVVDKKSTNKKNQQ